MKTLQFKKYIKHPLLTLSMLKQVRNKDAYSHQHYSYCTMIGLQNRHSTNQEGYNG